MRIGEDNKSKFLKDEPYYANKDDFCLGKNLYEAGDIVRIICDERKSANE